MKQIKLWCTRRESGGTAPLILEVATRRRLSGQLNATTGWVDPIARLDVLENIKISSTYQESNPERPARSLGSTLGWWHRSTFWKIYPAWRSGPHASPGEKPLHRWERIIPAWHNETSRAFCMKYYLTKLYIRRRLEIFISWEFRHSDDMALPILYACTWLSLLPYKFTETSVNFYHTTRSQIPENVLRWR